jgi:hypothetical protein
MSTIVVANTATHSVTFTTDKMLRSLQLIIRDSGLDPSKLAEVWDCLDRGIRTWLGTHDLLSVVLEVFDPRDNELVGRWDFGILYDYDGEGDGGFWADTDAIRFAIRKAGLWPMHCAYGLVVVTKNGRPDVEGWARTTMRSTAGFVRHSIGSTIGAGQTGASLAYWRKA